MIVLFLHFSSKTDGGVDKKAVEVRKEYPQLHEKIPLRSFYIQYRLQQQTDDHHDIMFLDNSFKAEEKYQEYNCN